MSCEHKGICTQDKPDGIKRLERQQKQGGSHHRPADKDVKEMIHGVLMVNTIFFNKSTEPTGGLAHVNDPFFSRSMRVGSIIGLFQAAIFGLLVRQQGFLQTGDFVCIQSFVRTRFIVAVQLLVHDLGPECGKVELGRIV